MKYLKSYGYFKLLQNPTTKNYQPRIFLEFASYLMVRIIFSLFDHQGSIIKYTTKIRLCTQLYKKVYFIVIHARLEVSVLIYGHINLSVTHRHN